MILFHIDKQKLNKIGIIFLKIDICAIALHTKWVMLFMLNRVIFQRHFADYGRFLTTILIYEKVSEFLVGLSKRFDKNFTGSPFHDRSLNKLLKQKIICI